MILGENREQVIENIRLAAEKGDFHSKVETGDPVLTAEQKKLLLYNYQKKRATLSFGFNSRVARSIAHYAGRLINRKTRLSGLENIRHITGGAILTSNHFSPLDNTILRILSEKMGKKKLCIVSQETNLAMTGWIGYLMNYADIIPISSLPDYMSSEFEPQLKESLDKNNYVLIYPEQEMWFNYRKPRPLKRGAYYYAAKYNVPVISCFVEMRTLEEPDTPEFQKIQYVLHILPAIYPDSQKSIRENSIAMCETDYHQKKSAYEAAYQKTLDYRFEPEDIAGFRPSWGRKD